MTMETAKIMTWMLRTRMGSLAEPKLTAAGQWPNGSAGYAYISAPNRYWITLTSATATPRLETRVRSGSAPRPERTQSEAFHEHLIPRGRRPQGARMKANRRGTAAFRRRLLKPNREPVRA